jgi:hypothetical protein
VGLICDNRGAAAALRLLERHKRGERAAMSPNVTVAAIPVAEGVEVRASLSRWGGRESAASADLVSRPGWALAADQARRDRDPRAAPRA